MTLLSDSFWPWMSVVVGLLTWTVATRLRIGHVLAPFSVALLMLIAIFGIRPLLMLDAGSYDFYGRNIYMGFRAATVIGFVSILAFVIGYGATRLRDLHQTHNTRRTSTDVRNQKSARSTSESAVIEFSPKISIRIGVSLVIFWFLCMVLLGGGVGYIATLFAGRSAAVGETFTNVPVLLVATPVVASLLIAVVRFRVERVRPYTRAEQVGYWLVAALCVIPPSALGNRRFLIPVIIAVLVGAAGQNWHKRVPARWVAAGFAVFLVIAIFPFVRSAGSRTAGANLIVAMTDYFQTEGVSGILGGFFLSYDTEMFNYIAFLQPKLGDTLPFGWGRGTLGEALLAPLPSAIAPVQTWSNQLLTMAFGGTCTVGICPVPSVVGTLYYDLALPGVVLGMLVLGILCTRYERAILASTGRSLHVFLTLGAFTAVTVRGNPVSQLWIGAQCLILLLILDWITRQLAELSSPRSRVPRGASWCLVLERSTWTAVHAEWTPPDHPKAVTTVQRARPRSGFLSSPAMRSPGRGRR